MLNKTIPQGNKPFPFSHKDIERFNRQLQEAEKHVFLKSRYSMLSGTFPCKTCKKFFKNGWFVSLGYEKIKICDNCFKKMERKGNEKR